MKKLILAALMLAIVGAACSRYSQEEAIFVGHNTSNDRVAVIVDGREVFQISANTSADFTVILDVARRRVNDYGTAPNQVDKLVQVVVAFKNLRTQRLTIDQPCTAGAKVKTSVTYETPSYAPEGRASCYYLQTYGAKEDKKTTTPGSIE